MKAIKISVTLQEELVDEILSELGANSVREAVTFLKMLLNTMLRKEGFSNKEVNEILSFVDMEVVEDDNT